jgi:hypothetical protein
MKKSKEIALMLIGMIAFTYVGANVQHAQTTTSEMATISEGNIAPANSYEIAQPNFALAQNQSYLSISKEQPKTTTRVKECKLPSTSEVIRPDLPLKVGWCI